MKTTKPEYRLTDNLFCVSYLNIIGIDELNPRNEVSFTCSGRKGHPGNHTCSGSQYPGNKDKKKRKDYTVVWACADEV